MLWSWDWDLVFSFLTLTFLELVLGFDNLICLVLISDRVQPAYRLFTRSLGLALALIMRLAMLGALSWLIRLDQPWWSLGEWVLSKRDVVLILGGLFLLYKGTREIHHILESAIARKAPQPPLSVASAVTQIVLLDLVFSVDSVITAVGMTDRYGVMVAAIGVTVLMMWLAAQPIGAFIERHVSIKILGFCFILLVGLVLLADGCGLHIPRGYVYSAIMFSMLVEWINLKNRGRR